MFLFPFSFWFYNFFFNSTNPPFQVNVIPQMYKKKKKQSFQARGKLQHVLKLNWSYVMHIQPLGKTFYQAQCKKYARTRVFTNPYSPRVRTESTGTGIKIKRIWILSLLSLYKTLNIALVLFVHSNWYN